MTRSEFILKVIERAESMYRLEKYQEQPPDFLAVLGDLDDLVDTRRRIVLNRIQEAE